MNNTTQGTFLDYDGFVDKFKVKKTTDDCYTPDDVFEVIKNWVHDKYGIDTEKIVRPFYPGGDYQSFDYPDDCIVLDNPPFSMSTKIVDFYLERNIPFFLFAPTLSAFYALSAERDVCVIFGMQITYANGAKVLTAFVTSLDKENAVIVAPELNAAIKKLQKNIKVKRRKLKLPKNLITSVQMNRLAEHGQQFKIKKTDCACVNKVGTYQVFGSGLLVTDEIAKEKERIEIAIKENMEKEKENREEIVLDDKSAAIICQLHKEKRA